MPHLSILTNVPRSAVPEDFLKTSSALIAKILKKPESVCLQIHNLTWSILKPFFTVLRRKYPT